MLSKSFEAVQLLHGAAEPRLCLSELAGRFVELSGEGASCVLTLAMGLVLDAQRQGEPVAWLGSDTSVFHPADADESGVDLESLILVRIKSTESNTKSNVTARIAVSAERLLRSGAFGLLVLDLGKAALLAQPLQTRLLGLAQKHHAALVCLTEKRAADPSLGSLVSLHAQAVRSWIAKDSFACEARILKDKRRGPLWSQREVCRGPMGLR